jgi:hypothetical protein
MLITVEVREVSIGDFILFFSVGIYQIEEV